MATAGPTTPGPISSLGSVALGAVTLLGDFSLFSFQTIGWMLRRRRAPGTLLPSLYLVGVRSVPVVAVTGMFIGMVMAVQMFNQFTRWAWRPDPARRSKITRANPGRARGTMLAGRWRAMAAERPCAHRSDALSS